MYVACYQQSKTSSLFPWSLGQYNHVKKKKEKKKMLIICPSAKKVSPLTYMIYSFIHDVQIFPFIFFFKKFFPYFSLFFFKWDKYNTTLNMARIVWKKIFTINHMFWRFLPQLIWNLKDLDSGTTDISGNVFFFNCDLLYLTEQHSLLWFCIIEIFFLIKYVVCHSNQQTLFFVNS